MPRTSLFGPALAVVALTLLFGSLMPRAIAQQSVTSSIEVFADVSEPGGSWVFCGPNGVFETAPVTAATTPTPARVGSPVEFQIRKISEFSSGCESFCESLELGSITRFPFEDAVPEVLSASQISLTSNPALPQLNLPSGTLDAQIQFVPSKDGLYRFEFFSRYWEGGQCLVDVPVEQSACVITRIDGEPPGGSSTEGLLNFGEVPLGQTVPGTVRLSLSGPFPAGNQLVVIFDGNLDSAFAISRALSLSPGRDQAFAEVTFTPDRTGLIRSELQVYQEDEESLTECWVDLELRGVGAAPELSIDFLDPVCGDSPRTTVVITNESPVPVDSLDARAPAGFRLTPDPPGSFRAASFALGPEGSSDPPSQRRFLLEYPDSPPSEGAEVVVRQGSTELASELIPPAPACVEVSDPAQLTLNLGDVAVNDRATGSITLLNRGDDSVTVSASLGSDGRAEGFGLGDSGTATTQQFSLPARATASLAVSFLPTTVGLKQSAVSFSSPDVDSIDSVTLIGNATAEPAVMLTFRSEGTSVSPGSVIRFPATQLGQTSSMNLEIVNVGDLTALDVRLSTDGDFAVTSNIPSDLTPNEATLQTIAFTPAQSGIRPGTLTVSGANLSAPIEFPLEGEGLLGEVSLSFVGLDSMVDPAETPAPTVGLTINGDAPADTIEGDLIIEFEPNTAQAPGPEFATAYSVVRFITGAGTGGRTIGFRIGAAQTQAVFPSEADAGAEPGRARYQSGTVAGDIRFRVMNLRTSAGTPISLVNTQDSTVEVERQVPTMTLTTERTGGGVNLIVDSVSTPREITGVCIAMNPAPNADLSFSRPDPGFLNGPFNEWFGDPASYPAGGAFTLTIPVEINNLNAFGSAQVWLRNSIGWSGSGSPCP